ECCQIDLGINIDTAFCNGDSLTISLYIKNVADSTFNGIVPVSFYDKNPTLDSSSFLLTTKQTATLSLLPEDSTQVVFQVPYPTSQVFAVVNDNALNLTPFVLSDSTFTGFYEECIYENNLDSIDFERPILTLDLGADTTVCENSAILLDAGPGFESYQWPDATIEQTYTAFETGIFTVEAFDICNTLYTDTIVIQLDTAIGIAIDPPIAFICPADSALLQIPILPDYTYQWFDANDQTICEGCQEIYVSPDQSTTYTVVATNTSGCVSADSILVNILDCEQVVELMVCEGESTSFAGQPFTAGEQDTMLINDTLFLIRVMQFPEAIETRDTFICPGSSVFFEGVELFAGSSTPFQYTSVNGCDSTFVLSVLEDPPIATQEEIGFCAGDSVLVFGQSVSETGSYSQNFIAANGCDSVHTIIVAPLATPEINVPDGFINCLSGTGALEVEIAPDIPILTVFWSTIESSRRIQNLQTGDYSVTVTALNGCTATSQGTVLESFADVTAEVFSNNISCFGANDGQISILNPNGGVPPYRFSLNGAPFSNQNSFEGLSEGNYRVEVRDANDCGTVFDIFIDEPSPLSVSLPAEIIVPLGDTIVLNPDIQSDRTLNYSWEPTTNLSCSNCPTPSLSPSENQQYTLFISDSVNCQASASVFIRLNRAGRIFIPNVFSPNGDGINDIFGIFMDNSVDRINTIRIYNRWGSAVFQRSNVDKAAAAALWDGTINGTELPSGTYVYSLEVTYLDGFTEVLSGEISLIR
ncbi:MAG: gliding motility-associated C-terminal domain-containing protein, partial [Bacteroidota bacterium]